MDKLEELNYRKSNMVEDLKMLVEECKYLIYEEFKENLNDELLKIQHTAEKMKDNFDDFDTVDKFYMDAKIFLHDNFSDDELNRYSWVILDEEINRNK